MAKATGELLETDKVQAVWAEVFVPLKQAIWHFDVPEAVRSAWLLELRDISRNEYLTGAKPVEEVG